jgi:hypothetical protein
MTKKNDEQNGILQVHTKEIQVLYEKLELAEQQHNKDKKVLLAAIFALHAIFHVSPDAYHFLLEVLK